MNHPKKTILTVGKKLGILATVVALAMASYATLGDGKINKENPKKATLLSNKKKESASFSLNSGYSFRGSQVINTESEQKYVRLNTVVVLKKGNTTFTVPLKKKVIVDKVKIDLSNRQFRSN